MCWRESGHACAQTGVRRVGLVGVRGNAIVYVGRVGGEFRKSFVVSVFFFFSSRRRHTRCSRDWSSDVCSSDLSGKRPEDIIAALKEQPAIAPLVRGAELKEYSAHTIPEGGMDGMPGLATGGMRSEERRVGKECRSGWAPAQWKTKIDVRT